MSAVEYLLCPEGMFYKSRLVWAGDYADNEPGSDMNVYQLSEGKRRKEYSHNTSAYRFIVNHTKKQYVAKGNSVNLLPILTAEGNGRGGGDYYGTIPAGSWARDVISMEEVGPEEFEMLIMDDGPLD